MSDIKIGTLVVARTGNLDKYVFGHVVDKRDIRYIVSWDNGFQEILSCERIIPYIKLVEELKNS